jgi:hypothetical protein
MFNSFQFGSGATSLTKFAVNNVEAAVGIDFVNQQYRLADQPVTFADAFIGSSPDLTYSTTSNSTMVNSSGEIVWAPHNLALNSAAPATQTITVTSGADYTVEVTGTGSMALTGAGTGTATDGSPATITASTTSLTITLTGSLDTVAVYRSDLGGMAPVPGAATGFETYVPTNGAAKYLPRVGHHVYNGLTWVNEGLLIESEARTNLLLNTAALSTQSATVTAAAHTLSFTGTGTVTLSGVSTDGPLVGTGTGENNRVALTFTPTAGTLTLTVSGTVSNAQLEAGATPSSYIPTDNSTVTRDAQTLDIPPAQFSWPAVEYIGSELVVDNNGNYVGDFNSLTDINSWSNDGTSIISILPEDQLFIDRNGSTTQSGHRVATIALSGLTIGKTYRVGVNVVELSNNFNIVVFDNSYSILRESTDSSSTGIQTLIFEATVTDPIIGLSLNALNATAKVTDVSVREINPVALSYAIEGRITANDDTGDIMTLSQWKENNTQRIDTKIRWNGSYQGNVQVNTYNGPSPYSADESVGSHSVSDGVLSPYNIAWRHTSSTLQAASSGSAISTTGTPNDGVVDLSAADMTLGTDYMGTISHVRQWNEDIGETGIEEATN